jgi:hypothetical protein
MRLLATAAFSPLLLVLAPSLTAQEKDKMAETPWYPLQVGNTWTYKLTTDAKAADAKMTVKVARLEKVGNKLCARLDTLIDGKVMEFEHLAVEPDGIYRYSLGGNQPDKPVCVLKLPPKKGQTWTIDSKIKDESLKGTVTAGEEEKLKVLEKEYAKVATAEAKDLDVNGLKVSFTYFYAEGFGPVKQVITVGNQKVTYELEEFKAAGK